MDRALAFFFIISSLVIIDAISKTAINKNTKKHSSNGHNNTVTVKSAKKGLNTRTAAKPKAKSNPTQNNSTTTSNIPSNNGDDLVARTLENEVRNYKAWVSKRRTAQDRKEPSIPENDTETQARGFGVNSDPERINFLMFHQSKSKNWTIKINDAKSLAKSGFDPKSSIKILIHGFMSSGNGMFPQNLKDAYITSKKKAVVFIVDWEALATSGGPIPLGALMYMAIAENVQIVGKHVAKFIKFLKVSSPDNVHIVGHSLGAHVAGVAGFQYFKSTNHKIRRITGLDPAGPSFPESREPNERLDKDDATFVDVVHTNAGNLGANYELGKADFYVNGGTSQPSCYKIHGLAELFDAAVGNILSTFKSETLKPKDMMNFDWRSCAHSKAHEYFAKSVIKTTTSCKCKSWAALLKCEKLPNCETSSVRFGEACPETAIGTYFVELEG